MRAEKESEARETKKQVGFDGKRECWLGRSNMQLGASGTNEGSARV